MANLRDELLEKFARGAMGGAYKHLSLVTLDAMLITKQKQCSCEDKRGLKNDGKDANADESERTKIDATVGLNRLRLLRASREPTPL